ncbi:MAG: DUF3467 domain-containing protein [Flavobacteriaceae bacterium]|nr:DUF3467 domain-containing protein [Flavobacteriaceae bacterium]
MGLGKDTDYPTRPDNSLRIEIDETTASGIYSNLAIVNHSKSEIILDFIQMMPGVQQAKVKSRIILAPIHAKEILSALTQNIENYQKQFGEIK